jgi:hypothetical protein
MEELQFLDLSADSYEMNLEHVLRATAGLGKLTFISLPKGAFGRTYSELDADYLPKDDHPLERWPPNLKSIQVNEYLPPPLFNAFLKAIPDSLHCLSIVVSTVGRGYAEERWSSGITPVPQITSLVLIHGSSAWYSSIGPCCRFPNLDKLTLRYSGGSLGQIAISLLVNPTPATTRVRCLRVIDDDSVEVETPLWSKWKSVLGEFPSVKQLEFSHKSLFSSTLRDDEVRDLEELEDMLAQRRTADAPEYDHGVFFLSPDEMVDPPWYQTVYRYSETRKHWIAFK